MLDWLQSAFDESLIRASGLHDAVSEIAQGNFPKGTRKEASDLLDKWQLPLPGPEQYTSTTQTPLDRDAAMISSILKESPIKSPDTDPVHESSRDNTTRRAFCKFSVDQGQLLQDTVVPIPKPNGNMEVFAWMLRQGENTAEPMATLSDRSSIIEATEGSNIDNHLLTDASICEHVADMSTPTTTHPDRKDAEDICLHAKAEALTRRCDTLIHQLTTLESTVERLQKDCEDSRLREERQVSAFEELSQENRKLESLLRRANDKRHKDFLEQVETQVTKKMDVAELKLAARLKKAEEKLSEREKATEELLARDTELIKSEREAFRLAREDMKKKNKMLQENLTALEEGYNQIGKDSADLELHITTLQDELHDCTAARDDLKVQAVKLSLQTIRVGQVGQKSAPSSGGIQIVVPAGKTIKLDRLRRIKEDVLKQHNQVLDNSVDLDHKIKDIDERISAFQIAQGGTRSRGSARSGGGNRRRAQGS